MKVPLTRDGTVSRAWRALRRRLNPTPRITPILQMTQVECGVACLAMILTYYGRPTTLSDCRDASGVGRDGLSAAQIVRAARRFGLQARGLSVEPSELRKLRGPAIIHWEFNHFVVLERWTPQRVRIVDPASGRVSLTQKEFDAAFTGVVLTFEPGTNFGRHPQGLRRQRETAPMWRRYLSLTLTTPGVRNVLIQVLVASLVLQVMALALPIFTKVLVDGVLALRVTDLMPVIAMGMLAVVVVQTATYYLRAMLLTFLQGRIDGQLMSGFFDHLLSLPYDFFLKRTSGDLLMRLSSNTMIRELMTSQSLTAVLDGVLVSAYMLALFIASPTFAFLVLLLGLMQLAVLVATHGRVHDLSQRELTASGKAQSYLIEVLSGIATLKASGAEAQVFDHWSSLFVNQLNLSVKRGRQRALLDTITTGLHTLSALLLIWLGARQVLAGEMGFGTMLALVSLASATLTPLASLIQNGQQLQQAGAHLERIADVVDAIPEQDATAVIEAPRLAGCLEMRGVSFRYDPESPLVLKNISLQIEPGQKIALVGRSGSGKTTLSMLLLGLFEPTEGEILFDGLDARTLDLRSLRSQFGVVLQDSFLVSGSIRQNIALGRPEADLEQVQRAAAMAAIHDEIDRLPMGYETYLAEGGAGLSGGQRQRLAIARALVGGPSILVLDEATSHLDVLTEAVVDANLDHLGCTRLVLAHRLSTIQNADLIVVLDRGEVVEQGTHHRLLSNHGLYADLIKNQPFPLRQ